MKSTLPLALFAVAAIGMLASAPAFLHADEVPAAPSCGAGYGSSHAKAASKDLVDVAVGAGSFDTLVTAVKAAGLVETLKGKGPFTVFAPSDEAFAALPAGTVEGLLKDKAALRKVLTYHVVPGKVLAKDVVGLQWAKTVQGQSVRVTTRDGEVFLDDARVVSADIPASNGVIHVLDKVILPRKDIVDTAVANGSFKTLVTAVKAAELVETLKGKGPFTVFAPSDAAFAKLPEGTVAGLVKDKPALQGVLTYHVIPGRVLSSDLKVGTTEVKTVQGQSVLVTRSRSGTVTVNGATVTTADVLTGNGVIHVIDAVILPAQSR